MSFYEQFIQPNAAAFLIAFLVILLVKSRKCFICSMTSLLQRHDFQVRVDKCLKQRDETQFEVLNPSNKPNSKLDSQFLTLSVKELHDAYNKKSVKVTDVIALSCWRSRSVGRCRLNAVTQERYNEAMLEACDLERTSSVSDGKPLWGVPVSIKDHIDQRGYLSTSGCASRCSQPAEYNSLLVNLLIDAGAIPVVRSNVSQLMMMPEANNNVWGKTDNPWNEKRTCGGSSGGEAALVSSRCTMLGLGSDIGGSIRIPAHFCGVCGFKPTPMRTSSLGVSLPFKAKFGGNISIRSTCGPIGRYVNDLARFMQALWVPKMFELDHRLPPLLFNKDLYTHGIKNRPIRMGYFDNDSWFTPCPSSIRAVNETVEALGRQFKDDKIQLVPFQFPHNGKANGWEVARLYYSLIAADGNMHYFKEALDGEKLHVMYNQVNIIAQTPNCLRSVISFLLDNVFGDKRGSMLFKIAKNGGLSARELFKLQADLQQFQYDWMVAMDEQELDCIMFPATALPAIPHLSSQLLTPQLTYTFLPNLLHWPSGVVPVTQVMAGEDCYPAGKVKDILTGAATKAMEGSCGLPIAVQVMTRPYADELCLHIMEMVEKATGVWVARNVPPVAENGLN